jgi:hypothetical protein
MERFIGTGGSDWRLWRKAWVLVGFKALAMEPPRGFWDTALNFLKFLPYFIGLLILGVIKSPDVAVVVGVRRAVLAKRGR